LAQAEIAAGVCGFTTQVQARQDAQDPFLIHLEIHSDCKAVQRFAEHLTAVNAFEEIKFNGKNDEGPKTLKLAPQCLSHPACPVPSGIIKAVEVEAGLALPKDVSIKISR
jgi:hypothetical protein